MRSVEDLSDLACTDGASTLTDGEAKTCVASNRREKLHLDLYVVTGHHDLLTLGQLDVTGYVKCTDEELRTVVVAERRVTTTLLLLEDVDGSLKLRVRLHGARSADDHTTLQLILVNTTEQDTYVVTCLTTGGHILLEGLHAGYGRLQAISTETDDLYSVTGLDATGLYTAGSYGTTTGDGEDILDRHEERLVQLVLGSGDILIDSIHQVHNGVDPLLLAVEGAESRAVDDGGIVAIVVVLREQITSLHINELEHLLILDHIALVDKYDDAGDVHLTSEQDVLTGLRHRTISSGYYEDGTIHLSGTGHHVLDIVGVPGAVYVSIVTSYDVSTALCTLYSIGIQQIIKGLTLAIHGLVLHV